MSLKDKLKNVIDGAANQAFFGATLGIPYDLAPGIRKLRNFVQTRQLPNNGGSYQSPTVGPAPTEKPKDFTGLYGTNQNYEGPGGFNYAKPQIEQPSLQDEPTGVDTPTTDLQYTMDKINETIGTQDAATLFSLRQRLARDQGLAAVGQLPTDTAADPVFDGLGITDGAPRYDFAQRQAVNKATADIYEPQINALDDLIKAQKDTDSGSELSSSMLSKVQTMSNSFDKLGVVKNFNAISEAKQFVDSLGNTTTNPSDDQGLIYAFAKTMDPDSAVREGEYATAQKYSQSMINSFGKSVSQALKGTGFLTPEARENMKKTINSKYKANKSIYDNTYNEYARKINNITGRNDGSDYLTNYSGYSNISDTEETFEANGATWRLNPDGSATEVLGKVGGGTKQATNRPQRNNNPLNIKASNTTIKYPGVAGLDKKPASDGGQFLVFKSPQDGFNAAKTLIQSGGYKNLTVDQALRRWSNSGYGGEIVPGLRGKPVNRLTPQELDTLIKTMAHREGYFA